MVKKIRCAIYTRKSSEEGLEQEFNSLDAQYEACTSYIQSQKHEGWRLVKNGYDDGGISGGTLARPGLQKLLEDIDAGLIDMIILYKIDRLTRSLADFMKIVERLDAKNASFVSVTQSFNTATSMGRLTLNMLLSFAQFEREVTGERIRDKIAASKAKGMWMGGTVPIGYDSNPDKNIRGLIINTAEAKTVKQIYDLYEELKCITKVTNFAKQTGLRSKIRKGKSGAEFSRGAIYNILTNPLYMGMIKHKEKLFDGQHAYIIEPKQWHKVQEMLQEASAKRRGRHEGTPHNTPLIGKLFDETGDRLTPSHSKKNREGIERIHRYYVSNRLLTVKDPAGWRLPAKVFETALANCLSTSLVDTLKNHLPQTSIDDHRDQMHLKDQIEALSEREKLDLISRCDLHKDKITITLDSQKLREKISNLVIEQLIIINTSLEIRKRGVEQKLIIGGQNQTPNKALIKNLVNAHAWLKEIKSGRSIKIIADESGKSTAFIRTRMPLALLSPKIQRAIMSGTQPTELTADHIIKSNIPMGWQTQEQVYGFSGT